MSVLLSDLSELELPGDLSVCVLLSDLSELELPCEAGGCESDAANRELYGLLLDSVAALHQRQLSLSDGDCRQLQQLVGERERPESRPRPPFGPGTDTGPAQHSADAGRGWERFTWPFCMQ